jgi:hypothetical protein
VLTPQLIFSHLLADFVYQTQWVVKIKHAGWKGLILHGSSFFVLSIIALAAHLNDFLWFGPPLLILTIEHILQDRLKIVLTDRFPQHGVLLYFLDQAVHFIGILVVNALVGHKIDPKPDNVELLLFMLGGSVLLLSRAWEITVIANWRSMREYTQQWLLWGYAERIVMLIVIAIGGIVLIPVAMACVIPRLVRSYQLGHAIWKHRPEVIELGSGVIVSTILGLGIWNLLQYI